MAEMDWDWFQHIVYKRVSTNLKTAGYDRVDQQVDKSSEVQDVVFRKMLLPGIRCEVSYQLLLHFIEPSERAFMVNLRRKQMPGFSGDKTQYRSLAIDLRNVMLGVYRTTIFPSGVYDWEFIDEETLEARVDHAQSLLLDYGIKWLEDRLSTMDWTTYKGSW